MPLETNRTRRRNVDVAHRIIPSARTVQAGLQQVQRLQQARSRRGRRMAVMHEAEFTAPAGTSSMPDDLTGEPA
jgi:hypothetical protein